MLTVHQRYRRTDGRTRIITALALRALRGKKRMQTAHVSYQPWIDASELFRDVVLRLDRKCAPSGVD